MTIFDDAESGRLAAGLENRSAPDWSSEKRSEGQAGGGAAWLSRSDVKGVGPPVKAASTSWIRPKGRESQARLKAAVTSSTRVVPDCCLLQLETAPQAPMAMPMGVGATPARDIRGPHAGYPRASSSGTGAIKGGVRLCRLEEKAASSSFTVFIHQPRRNRRQFAASAIIVIESHRVFGHRRRIQAD